MTAAAATPEPTAGHAARASVHELATRREYLRTPQARYPVQDVIDDLVGKRERTIDQLLRAVPVGAAKMGTLSTQTEFSPDDISSLAHWYDATEITGSDGDSIGTWTDEEATDDLTQSTSSKQFTLKTGVINGNNIARSDGSSDLMDVDWSDISEPWMIFVAGQYASTGGGATVLDGLSKNESRYQEDGNGDHSVYQGSSVIGGSATDTNAHVFTLTFRSGTNNDELRIDGSQDLSGDSGNATLTGLTLGASGGDDNHANFDFGEVLIYNTELSTSDRDEVESYLGDRWGVSI